MGVNLKAVKPKAFNGLAFRLAYIRTGAKVAKEIEKDYIKTTKKWKKKPVWIRKSKISDKEINIFVGTENEIYGYVDYGTKAHIIRPRKKQFLRFIGSSYQGRGRPRGSDYVFTKLVNHPGFKGYKHSKRIAKVWQPKIKRRFNAATKVAAQKSGHSYK